MKHNHRIFVKGELCHSLLYSYNHPNILIPVKGFIKDMKWDPINPQYRLKVLKFYDSYDFIKEYFFDMNFVSDFGGRAKKLSLNAADFKNTIELEEKLKGPEHNKYLVVADSIMSVKTKSDMRELFNKVQYAIICKKLKEVRELSTRTFYRGVLKIDTATEYRKRMHKFIGDQFEDQGESFTSFSRSI